ncbi:MAG TPA: hypothetical protein VMF30_17580, partial [Pirellulales bacterium]|nr:hypothetical protein [Pirellulales bacterium]
KAITAIDPASAAASRYFDRLNSLKQISPDGKLAWWEMAPDSSTAFYGRGHGGSVETTALAALAMIETHRYPETSRAALAWLVAQKGPHGLWPSTQATVLALKALITGTGAALGTGPRQVDIAVDGHPVAQVAISADEFDVVREIDLSNHVGTGAHQVSLVGRGAAPLGYQVVARHYVPQAGRPTDNQPLSIDLVYARTELPVEEAVEASATVVNHQPAAAPMVLVDLPIPPGFAAAGESFASLVADGKIDKFQLTPRSVIVYLRGLEPEKPLALPYRLNATLPVKASVSGATAYEYYNPDVQATSAGAEFTVHAR